MKKEKKPEFVYIHRPQCKTMTCSSETKFDGNLTIISVKKLTDDAEKVELSSIKEKCYINGYGQYNPKQK
jgi:hypothetical protein